MLSRSIVCAAVFLQVSSFAWALDTKEYWRGNDVSVSYEIAPTDSENAESDANYATVLRITCDGFDQKSIRYLMGFGVSAPGVGRPRVGVPIIISVDGVRHDYEGFSNMWDREGEVHAFTFRSTDPLLAALKSGSLADLFIDDVFVKSIHLKGTAQLLNLFPSDC